ncbi:hypothetical protein GGQ74_002202 [Desulfobaculum xiamenense]|uniref:Uncharacterized protein n=1 Tax=Desulfobaculum xiamenense TaxID=995050 RepID=A0A846QV56_9BACT|nr:hypothetical protein [Desulfobaculum xiamenense]NJB68529.1 hypothetical protein [Desulfobaculum xiamenense]
MEFTRLGGHKDAGGEAREEQGAQASRERRGASVRITLGREELAPLGVKDAVAEGQRFELRAEAVAGRPDDHGDAAGRVPFALKLMALAPQSARSGDNDEDFYRAVFEGGV